MNKKGKIKITLTNTQITNICLDHFNDTYDVQAIYLTGSRLRGLNRADSDYDLIIFVNPVLKRIFNHQRLISKQVAFAVEQNIFDCKIYEKAKLEQMLFKGNPNLLDLFSQKGLFIAANQTNRQLFNLLEHTDLFSLDPIKSFAAFKGMIRRDEAILNKTTKPAKKDKARRNLHYEIDLLGHYLHASLPRSLDYDPETVLASWQQDFGRQMANIDTNLLNLANKKALDDAFMADFVSWCQKLSISAKEE